MTHITVSSVALGLLFTLSAAGKWSDFNWFSKALQAYKVVPHRVATLTAIAVLLAETMVAMALLLRVAPEFTGYATVALLCLFTFAISINMLRGRTTISCGCGLAYREDRIDWFLVARNVFLIVIALVTTGLLASNWALSRALSIAGVVGATTSIWIHGAGPKVAELADHAQKTIA